MKHTCDRCGWVQFAERANVCPRCKGTGTWTVEESLWVRTIRHLRKPQDRGIGDTVQRIAARFGGERFKSFSARIGIPCGCTERQDEWNRLWPYSDDV